MATPTPEEEIKALKAKIELQLKSNALTATQVANQTSAYNAITNGVGALERYRDLLKSNQLIIDDIADGLDYMTKSFLDDIAHLTKGKSLLNDHKSAMNKLANIAKETLDIRLGEQAIDEKRFKKLQDNATKQINNLKLVRDLNAQSSTPNPEISKNIQAQIDATIELKNGFSKVSEVNEELNKKLGAAPKLVAGIDKAFSKLGLPDLGFSQALDETKQLGQEAASQGDEEFKKFSPMKTLTGKIGSNFKEMFTTANLLQAGIGLMIDALIKGDTATGDLAKDFNITYNEAANVREELIQIGNLSGNVALNARALQESMVAVGKSLGSNAMLNQADLETFTELREMAGYTNEELIGMQKITLATGGNLKDNTKQFLGTVSALNAQNKLTVNEKQLLKEVANTSAAIKLSVGGTTKGLAEAAFKAKQFGINLEQADKMAESLLDFESSITNELSAELLTGKDLNLEKARLLALNGDIAGASAEILKQVGGTAEFTKMNRIQQEALAKAVGMSREDLAASLIEREALQKIGVKDAVAAKAKFDLLVKEKGYAAAVAELGDEQYATQLKQQSIQERFNKSVEKLQEIFISIAEPILQIVSPLMDLLNIVLPGLNVAFQVILTPIRLLSEGIGAIVGLLNGGEVSLESMGKLALGLVGTFGIYRAIMLGITAQKAFQGSLDARAVIVGESKVAQAVAETVAAAIRNPFLALAGLAVAGIVGAAIYSSMKDGVIDPSKGPILSGGFGSVQLNPKDKAMYGADGTIKVGTNLGGGKSNSPQQDNSALIAEIRAMRQEQARSNLKPTIVENSVNGTRFGTAVAMNTYKIQ